MPGNSKPLVSFICQKCSQPLKLDPSISESNRLSGELLTNKTSGNPATPNDQVQTASSESQQIFAEVKDASAEIKILPSYRHLDHSTDLCNDFTIVGIPEVQTEEVLSRKMTMICHLFDFLSGHTEIDHPLCEECTDNLLDQLDRQLSQAQSEYQKYSKLLEKFNSMSEEADSSKLDEELKKLAEEEARLEREMAEVERKQRIATEELAKEKKLAVRHKEESARYHEQYEEYKRQLFEYEDAQKGVDSQLKYAGRQLEKLTKTNVFNVTFHIWHEGHFGTINGFRMGRLPGFPVDWNEINAGWGQAALLLHSLANNIGLTFKKYKIVPYGNRSYIESLMERNKEFPLYGSGGFKFFWDTKFDDGMVAFLDCLQQFKEELEKRNPDCCLPYKMDNGRIQHSKTGIQYTIKVLLNSEEQWTKALKLMLTNLKWGLVWVAADGCPISGEEMETISETPEDKSDSSLTGAKPSEKIRTRNKIA